MQEEEYLKNPLQPTTIVLEDLRKNWGWFFALGVVFLILGVIGLGMTPFLTQISMIYFGILLMLGGVIQLVRAFRAHGAGNLALALVIAVLYGLAGVVILRHPMLASTFFTAVIAFILIFEGILKIYWGIRLRDVVGSWFWPVIMGVISLLLGITILDHWPISGLWVIGLFIAIELIIQGWAYIMVALKAKSLD